MRPHCFSRSSGGMTPARIGWPDTMKRLARAAGLELTEDGTFREIAAAH